MKRINKKIRVAVAMSGGVDSSVSAYLLKKAGYDVAGFFMKNWSELSDVNNDCPWESDFKDMRAVCQHLDIPYYTFNFEKEYKEKVLNYFFKEYQKGRVPNPDIICNSEIKFKIFLEKIKKLGFDYMATGHYAKLDNKKKLVEPKDKEKNQTYFLCRLNETQLNSVIFPLADFTKNEVRKIALKAGIPTAKKKDSQGICFIGEISVKDFLKKNLNVKEGNVLTTSGKIIGKHEGSELYTIGQRRIGVSGNGKAFYVLDKNIKKNTVTVGEEVDLFSKKISFKDAIWYKKLPQKFDCDIQTRYRTKTISGTVTKKGEVTLKDQARAITSGQYLAFYQNKTLIGSGVIK